MGGIQIHSAIFQISVLSSDTRFSRRTIQSLNFRQWSNSAGVIQIEFKGTRPKWCSVLALPVIQSGAKSFPIVWNGILVRESVLRKSWSVVIKPKSTAEELKSKHNWPLKFSPWIMFPHKALFAARAEASWSPIWWHVSRMSVYQEFRVPIRNTGLLPGERERLLADAGRWTGNLVMPV